MRKMTVLGCRRFRHLLARGLRRSAVLRLPKGAARLLFSLPGGRKWADYRLLEQAGSRPLRLQPGRIELIPGLTAGDSRAAERCDALLADLPGGHVTLGKAAVLVRDPRKTAGGLAGRRVALMAHWDPDGVLDPYVRHYVAGLQKLGFVVVLAAERALDLGPEETPGLPEGVTRRGCSGYDFTSWKAAFEALPELYDAAELLLCNDSVFAPVGSLSRLFAAMADVPCDFWGGAESIQHKPHLPSYFLCLRRRAVASPALREFFARVGTAPEARRAVDYELDFSLWLARHGLVPAAALPQAVHGLGESIVHYAWEPCLRAGLPFMKRNILAVNPLGQDLRRAPEALRSLGYPLELVRAYFERRGVFTGLDFGPPGRGGASILMTLSGPVPEAAGLIATLASLQAQTCADWELVVVHAEELPSDFVRHAAAAGRVRLVRLPRGLTGLAALRFALAQARGENLTFLKPGDVLRPDGLECRLAALGPDAGAVLCDPRTTRPGRRRLLRKLLAKDALPPLPGLLLPKESLHGAGWDAPVGTRPVWWLCGQIALGSTFTLLPWDIGRTPPRIIPRAVPAAQREALAVSLADRAGRRHDARALLRLLRASLV